MTPCTADQTECYPIATPMYQQRKVKLEYSTATENNDWVDSRPSK